ncbi:MAG: CRISPR-associated protein Cas4 [Caldilineaceae bacterium]|nr:CRISPR-associated protein Cas4 [Caldilineaceae bacterium]MCB0122432.1 CRISPR-associated protein Cas4 [Caldilineaceae bacterium]
MTDDYLSLSYINHFAYCARRFWYIYVQGEMRENVHVLRGNLNHERVDTPGYATEKSVTQKRRVYVVSHSLRITGICDLLEVHSDGTLVPVEYKQGQRAKWINDQAQLCAQALCLEEMTGKTVTEGAIFYFGSRRRLAVPFTPELRQTTEALITAMHHALAAGHLPAHTTERQRCNGCSLIDLCLPEEITLLSRAGG